MCGDAGDALGDSIYEARLYVRARLRGLGADCIEKELRDEHVGAGRLLERAGIDDLNPGRLPALRLGTQALQLLIDNASAY